MTVALGPTLETVRLTLRPPVAGDLDGWAAYGGSPGSEEAGRRALAWRLLAAQAGSWALQGFGMFSVIERSSGRWVGRVGPWRPEGWPGPEIGWGLLPAARGRGYAFEAAAAAIDWAVDHLGWTEVIHAIDPANAPSIALARRLGATGRGPGRLPPPFEGRPTGLWGQTAQEWRARRPHLPSFGPHQPGR